MELEGRGRTGGGAGKSGRRSGSGNSAVSIKGYPAERGESDVSLVVADTVDKDKDSDSVHEHLTLEDLPSGDARHAYVARMERELFGT